MRLRSLSACFALAACGAEPGAAPRLAATDAPPAAPAGPRLPEWLPDPDGYDVQTIALAGGITGVAAAGLRAQFRRGEAPLVAEHVGSKRVLEIPGPLGGGFVFATQSALYRTDSFLGELKPLRAFDDRVTHAWVHPEGILVDTGERRVIIDTKTGARKPVRPVGLEHVAVSPKGYGVALLAMGDLVATSDGGATWKPLDLPEPGDGIWVDGDGIAVSLGSGRTFTAGADGKLAETPGLRNATRPKKLGAQDGWNGPRSPLGTAVLGGILVGPTSALVPQAGNLFSVSLLDGSILGTAKAAYDSALDCHPVSVRGPAQSKHDARALDPPPPEGTSLPPLTEGVLVCLGPKNAVVYGNLLSRPTVERTLPPGGRFFIGGDGALAYVAKSEEDKKDAQAAPPPPPGSKPKSARELDLQQTIWHRSGTGAWTEHVISQLVAIADPADLAADAPKPSEMLKYLRVVPTQAGALVLFGDADEVVQVDAAKGTALRLVASAPGQLGLFQSNVGEARERFDRHVTALGGGTYAGLWGWGSAYEVTAEGVIHANPRIGHVSSFGRHAISVDRDGQYYQSVDHGHTWTEIEAPPDASRRHDLTCGPLGCRMGGQLRLGWRASTPSPARSHRPPIGRAPVDVPEPRPRLTCLVSGKGVRKTVPPPKKPPKEDAPIPAKGLGASMLPGLTFDDSIAVLGRVGFESHGDATVLVAQPPQPVLPSGLPDRTKPWPRTLHSIDPFDPSAPIRRGGHRLDSLLSLYEAHGADPFSAHELWDLSALRVLMPPAHKGPPSILIGFPQTDAEGSAIGIWNGKDLAARWDPVGAHPLSAVARGDEVFVLHGTGVVTRHGPRGVAELLRLGPQTIEGASLALGPDSSLSVVWRPPPHDGPPTADDPALSIPIAGADLVPRKPKTSSAVVLAPWSTLTAANDPACRADKSGVRTILAVTSPWIEWNEAGRDEPVLSFSSVVRWSSQRICLEAVEVGLPADFQFQGGGTTLVARFDRESRDGSNAGVFRIDQGSEWREPRTCELTKGTR